MKGMRTVCRLFWRFSKVRNVGVLGFMNVLHEQDVLALEDGGC